VAGDCGRGPKARLRVGVRIRDHEAGIGITIGIARLAGSDRDRSESAPERRSHPHDATYCNRATRMRPLEGRQTANPMNFRCILLPSMLRSRRIRRCRDVHNRPGSREDSAVSDLPPLPRLGIGISAEFESARRGIDALALREEEPGLVDFLEYGCDLARGLDDHARRWAAAGLPATYHFLDLNLTEPDDADDDWLAATGALAQELGAAWLCGDGGLWHFGPRDRGHETLLPPVLTRDSALEMADAIRRVADATGMAVLPENPPSPIYLGDLHILDYFALVAERSGGGLLLDCAHLAIFQRMMGHAPLTGLDGFPLERVIEVHVAGGVPR